MERKVLSALCYLSILIVPFLGPLVLYFAIDDPVVKKDAKRGMWTQAMPFLFIPLIIAAIFAASSDSIPLLMFILFVLFSIAMLVVTIWNLIQGIRILAAKGE
ncbi:MAG: DUF4870 domain-containing protein [Bacillus sp. (in: firmicutes)]